jgi:16S rRNA (guanine527-N7)-methyltransferase
VTVPGVAAELFGDSLPGVEHYADILASAGVERGLIGPREVPRLWQRHLLNCAVVAPALPQAVLVADVGSGAGLPGLVLALARPDLSMVLVEPLLRRSSFLQEVVEELALTRVEVVRARAEELQGRRDFDAVVSRAVAPLERLARWSLPLVRPGGAMIAMKGASVEAELRAARSVITRLGGDVPRVEEYGRGVVEPPATVVRVVQTRTSSLGLSRPRRARRNRGRRAQDGGW